jgi:hypothetical protein
MNFEVELLQALAEDQYRRLAAEAERARLVGPRGRADGGGGAGKAVAGWLRTAADRLDQPQTQPA